MISHRDHELITPRILYLTCPAQTHTRDGTDQRSLCRRGWHQRVGKVYRFGCRPRDPTTHLLVTTSPPPVVEAARRHRTRNL